MLPDASEDENQHSQTVKQSPLCPFLLTVRCQPTTSIPSSTVPSLPWRFLLYSLQCLNCQPTKLPQTPVPRSPVQTSVKPHCSCTLPNLRCSTTHISFQYYIHILLSWTKVLAKLQPDSRFPLSLSWTKVLAKAQPDPPGSYFLVPISRHDAKLSSTTHCALRASRINYNLTNLSRCVHF